jgi:large subunit ribosomal protein L10
MPNESKIQAVAEIRQLFEEYDSFFITDYQGLPVSDLTVLRSKLRESNVKFVVAKNTLLKIGAKEAGVEGLDEHLTGPTAVAFVSTDAAPAAKILHDSFKDKELPRMKVFSVDGDIFEADQIKRLADLPSREVLLSQLVSTVEAPFTSLMATLDAVFQELVGTVDALAEKRQAEGPGETEAAAASEETEVSEETKESKGSEGSEVAE